MDDVSSTEEIKNQFAKYKKENVRTLDQTVIDKEYVKIYDC